MVTVPRKPKQWRKALVRRARKTRCPIALGRAQIIANAAGGREPSEIAEVLGCARSQVYRTLERYGELGWLGLLDGRATNGVRKMDETFGATVKNLLDQSPREYGYLRPTWTRELLILVTEEQTDVRISLSAMSAVLQKIGARRGRPKPVVDCPLSDRQKRRRLAGIRDLVVALPHDEVAVYEDEVDIHLNPKIGLDWMNQGTQNLVMTPGKNEKAYIAGALNARDGTVQWVGGVVKDSSLFVALLEELDKHYQEARRIHVVLDNYGIHSSKVAREALSRLPRIQLHFLPPYCPDHNRIERLWLDLHANVTRNHKHSTLLGLCTEVAAFLKHISPWQPVENEARPPLRLAA
jgi:transposase